MGKSGFSLSQYFTRHVFNDFTASMVNFAIQIATCFAVAIASGFPPTVGFITLIIGAFLVGPLSSCKYQVSTCAASMIALTWVVIDEHGILVFGLVVAVAGLFQIVAALFKWARWFGAVSPSLVFGLMTGIGLIVTLSQFLAVLGKSSRGNGLDNMALIWPTILELVTTNRAVLPSAAIGLLAAVLSFGWPRIPLKPLRLVPGALAALIIATLVAHFGDLAVQRSHVSSDLLGNLRLIELETIKNAVDWGLLWAALPMAFLASTESLLAATIIDRLHDGKKTDLDRELLAQGIGNVACGAVCCLPVQGSTSKGVANVEAGAKTRWAMILPGIWAVVLVLYFPGLLEAIPIVALSGVLLYVGIRLINLKAVMQLREYGKGEVLIYIATVLAMVAVDVSTGILVGFFTCLAKIVFTFSSDLQVELDNGKEEVYEVSLKGAATFLALPKLQELVKKLPQNKRIKLSLDKVYHIDYGCAEFLTQWARRLESEGGVLDVDWQRVRVLYDAVRNLLERPRDEARGWLVLVSGPLVGNRYRLLRCTVIGSNPEADVRLVEPGVSKQHAGVFEDDQGKMILIDMKSERGTFVGEERIEFLTLEPGQRFRIADSEFEYELESQEGAAKEPT